MEDNRSSERDEVFSKRIKAGKRTYFIDVKATRGNDYYIIITESKRKQGGFGYTKHKIFLYKEDFNKFLNGLNEVVDHVKKDLMPEFDFDKFSHEDREDNEGSDFQRDPDGLEAFANSFEQIEELEGSEDKI